MNDGRHGKDQHDRARTAPQQIRSIDTFRRLDEQEVRHGDAGDSRYPSATGLRTASAFVLDCILHAAPMVALFVLITQGSSLAAQFPQLKLWAVISWPILSFVDRVVIQRILHATVGKALFGLVAIRPRDGRWPTSFDLTKSWLLGIVWSLALAISVFGNYTGGSNGRFWDPMPSTVRHKDVIANSVGPAVTHPGARSTR
ncbi:RDD family protein [Rhodococcus sp. D2-41]|uniref:RDD family protein n=1 Tax=Speluncibacter jeojiensis TaxID=2710754 RepID=UPI00240F4B76|nr:RDD family protein [Rhodococcus sp. D2-41]MDG3012632.1 RDD family protein [Rhodococcus sp. D2-41]